MRAMARLHAPQPPHGRACAPGCGRTAVAARVQACAWRRDAWASPATSSRSSCLPTRLSRFIAAEGFFRDQRRADRGPAPKCAKSSLVPSRKCCVTGLTPIRLAQPRTGPEGSEDGQGQQQLLRHGPSLSCSVCPCMRPRVARSARGFSHRSRRALIERSGARAGSDPALARRHGELPDRDRARRRAQPRGGREMDSMQRLSSRECGQPAGVVVVPAVEQSPLDEAASAGRDRRRHRRRGPKAAPGQKARSGPRPSSRERGGGSRDR